jgi:hypothetical protein
MKLIRIFLIQFAIFVSIFLILGFAFSQVKRGDTISFSGMIESIGEDFEFIVINEARIFVSSETKIFDEKGNVLKIEELKPKLTVTIEAVRNPNGFLGKRIILNKLKR